MPTLPPGGKTGSAANAEEVAATTMATAARYRSGFMKGLPGLHWGRSMVGRRSVLFRYFRVVRAQGPFQSVRLLAFLSPVQQGREGFVPWAASETPSFFAGFARSVSFFEAFPAAKYRVPFVGPPSGGVAMLAGRCDWPGHDVVRDDGYFRFLNAAGRLQRPCHDL